jgi:peroxiredoxin
MMIGIVVALVVLAIGLVYAVCFSYQLLQQNGRILTRLDSLEQKLGAPQPAPQSAPQQWPSLPVGSEAPAFELPDLDGQRKSLADFRGKKLLVIFFNPKCGFCAKMGPDLGRLPIYGNNGRPVPLIITTGDPEENRKFFKEHLVRCTVLLQEQMEVASKYLANGTPMGYLIDEQGKIAVRNTVGAEPLLALANPLAGVPSNGSSTCGGQAPQGNKDLAESKINRDGLPAGTVAPSFRLPLVKGGEVALEDYRGRKLLLVFSAPDCGPCMQMAPALNRAAKQTSKIDVLMISKGDLDVNRAKVKEHALSFPVALQKQWEISKLYGMFATPIAFMIDEKGLIAEEVAVGEERIISLMIRSIMQSNGSQGAANPGKEAVPLRR